MSNGVGGALRALAVFVLMFSALGAVLAQEADLPEAPALLDARVTTTPDRARLVVDLSGPTEFTAYGVLDPDRIVVELRAAEIAEEDLAPPPEDGLVAQFDVRAAGEDRARITLVLAGPAQVQQSYVLEAFDDQPARLVIDIVVDTPENFAESARPAPEPEAEQAEAALDTASTAPGESNLPAESRPLIVLDPGHGGVDGGARAPNGLEEKNIVLAFALKLQQLLVATGRFDVALTRDTDVFLRLEDRVSLARQNQADLFISIHADSFDEPDVRGASVYTRDENATDALDRVLAENENRADLVAGFAPPEDEAEVVNILVDLMRRETRRQSYIAAQALVEQLEPSIQLRRLPLRQADFLVLQAPDVPSVLIELGFLSNTEDSSNLATDAWLDRVAAALARGVASYFDGLTIR